MAKRCLPGITKWDMYAGGTFCPDRVHNYGITAPKGNYKVSCTTNSRGRMQGYQTTFENVKGLAKTSGLHSWLDAEGVPRGMPNHYFRSPAAAAAAANKHCELMNQGLAGSRRRRRR